MALLYIKIAFILVLCQYSGSINCADELIPNSANISQSGAWCWFADPRAVHFENQTYVGFIDTFGNITVANYDHKTGQLTQKTLYEHMPKDDHSNPSIHIRPDKHILVFWSGHGGPHMFYRRSVLPLNISEWGPVEQVPVNTKGGYGYTYPNPVTLSSEGDNLYLFWRGGDFNPNFAKLDNIKKTWSSVEELVTVPGQRPYMKVRSNDKDAIHFAFTEAHPRNMRTSIFHMFYKSGNLHHTNGTVIGPMGKAIVPKQATLVYNANITGVEAWIHDVSYDPKTGYPVMTFATIFNISYHRYHYARWDGKQWFDKDLVKAGASISEDPSEPQYSAGITLDPDDPNVVHLARDVKGNNIMEIERWTTRDGGLNWSVETITKDSHEQNVRPYSPRGLTSNGTMSILWMAGRYPHYLKYQTRIKYLA